MKMIKKILFLLMVLAMMASGIVSSPKPVEAQTPVEKLAVFESFGWIH